MTSTGGEPSALAISTGPVLQRDVDVRAGHRVQPAEHALAALALRAAAVRRAAAASARRSVMCSSGIIALRSTDVPSVGIFIGITTSTPYGLPSVLSSSQVSACVELVGVVEPDAAEDAEAAGARDRGGDVLGRGEREDRVLDPEPLTERRCASGSGSCRRVRLAATVAAPAPWPGVLRLAGGVARDLGRRASARAAACSRTGARAGSRAAPRARPSAPSRGWTTAATAWPYFSSGTPTTSTS